MSEVKPEGPRRSGMMTFVLPALTAGVALSIGAVLGAAIVWVVKPPEIEEKLVPRDLTAEELSGACGPMVSEVAARVDEANDKVLGLVGEMREKEAKVKELEDEMKRRGARGAELKRELAEAKAELEKVKGELKQAIDDKEAVIVKLKKTEKDLEVSRTETEAAKEEARGNHWEAFINESQLEVCERGSRKKMGKCREAVQASLSYRKDRFLSCLRSGQEPPTVIEAVKNQELPRFAEYLDPENKNKIVKGWYVQLCDPSLPEAKTFAASAPSEDIVIPLEDAAPPPVNNTPPTDVATPPAAGGI